MASRTALRFVLLAEPWQPVRLNRTFVRALLRTRGSFTSTPRLSAEFRDPQSRDFHAAKRTQLNCSHNETPSSSQDDQGPPQEAVLKAISGSTTNNLYLFLSPTLFN